MGVKLDGSNVLLTGASSGIGAALAPMLAERGATVGVVGRREEKLAQVLDRCRRHSPASDMWVGDLGDLEWAEQVTLAAEEALGGLDVVVCNAGQPMRRPSPSLTMAEVSRTVDVNLLAPIRQTLAVLPRMLERGRGSLVYVSSLGGRLGIGAESAYCASKFGLCGWAEALAVDLWDEPVDVRLIIPGPVDTDIWNRPGNDPAHYEGPKENPAVVAKGIVAAIEGDRFEHYLPDLKAVVEFKTTDIEAFLSGAAQMVAEADAKAAADHGAADHGAADPDETTSGGGT